MPSGSLSPPYTGGRYYLQAIQQASFTAYVAAQATTVAGTSLVGLQLWNPPTSGRNLVLVDSAGMIIVSSAAVTSLVLAFGTGQVTAPTGQSAATTVTSCLLGPVTLSTGLITRSAPAATPVALATAAGTFTNSPAPFKNLLHNTAAIGTTGEDPGWQVDFSGKWIVPPGSYVAVIAVGAAVAAGGMNADLTWVESAL